eukprot:g4920.t1
MVHMSRNFIIQEATSGHGEEQTLPYAQQNDMTSMGARDKSSEKIPKLHSKESGSSSSSSVRSTDENGKQISFAGLEKKQDFDQEFEQYVVSEDARRRKKKWNYIKAFGGATVAASSGAFFGIPLAVVVAIGAGGALAGSWAGLRGKNGQKNKELTDIDEEKETKGNSPRRRYATHKRFLQINRPPPTLKRVRFLIKWASIKMDELEDTNHPGVIQLMDDVVSEFSLVVEAAKVSINGETERMKLLAFVRFLEKVKTYKKYAHANQVWLKSWEESSSGPDADPEAAMVLPSDAWLRLQFVFPTIINIAKILSAHEKTHKTMSLGCAAATSGGSIVNAIDHLADWCYSVLSMKRVKRFLTEYEAVAAQKMNWETESNQSNRLTNGPSGDDEDVDDMEDDPDQFPPEGAEDEFSDVSFHDAESDDEFDNNDVSETRSEVPSVTLPFRNSWHGCSPGNNPSRHNDALPYVDDEMIKRGAKVAWSHSTYPWQVRGKKYLQDKKKIPSPPPFAETVACDFCECPTELPCYARHPEGFVKQLRAAGEGRFLVIVNWRFTPKHIIFVFAMNKEQYDRALFQHFLSLPAEQKNKRFKFIPALVDGPWLVRQAVGTKPALIGTKIKTEWYQGEDFVEMSQDIFSSSSARAILGVVSSATKKLILEFSFLVEGQAEDELPEHVLGGGRVVYPDMDKCRKLGAESPSTPIAPL